MSAAPWDWPLAAQRRLVAPFDPPQQRWAPGHRGVDVAGTAGEPVLAVDAGTVAYSGVVAGVGVVAVRHGDGLRSTYQPVGRRAQAGTAVRRGQPLGVLEVGGSHCPGRACLHLGAVRGRDSYLDPMLLLQPWELALLPVP